MPVGWYVPKNPLHLLKFSKKVGNKKKRLKDCALRMILRVNRVDFLDKGSKIDTSLGIEGRPTNG